MLTEKSRKSWAIITLALSVVWIVVLADYYIIHFGWMNWPASTAFDFAIIGKISLVWWLVFLLKALVPILALLTLYGVVFYQNKVLSIALFTINVLLGSVANSIGGWILIAIIIFLGLFVYVVWSLFN
jgi:hypothetical protein